jgi:hypothetical protein
MKLLFAFVLIPCLSFAQQKNDNTIVIPNATTDQTIQIFRNHGYMIGAAAAGIVTTIPKKSPNNIVLVFEMERFDRISSGYLRQ